MENTIEKLSFIRKNAKWVICGIAIILVVIIIKDVFETEMLQCDILAYNFFVEFLRNDWLTVFFKVITWLGEAKILIAISLLSVFFLKNKKIAIAIAGNMIISAIINWGLKHIVQRARPDGYRLIDESGYSFPSGHAMTCTAFYGLIIYFIYKNVENKLLRNVLCIILSLLIVLLCCSRVYLGVHYASDVLAGLFIAIAYLIIFTTIVKKYIFKDKTTK